MNCVDPNPPEQTLHAALCRATGPHEKQPPGRTWLNTIERQRYGSAGARRVSPTVRTRCLTASRSGPTLRAEQPGAGGCYRQGWQSVSYGPDDDAGHAAGPDRRQRFGPHEDGPPVSVTSAEWHTARRDQDEDRFSKDKPARDRHAFLGGNREQALATLAAVDVRARCRFEGGPRPRDR